MEELIESFRKLDAIQSQFRHASRDIYHTRPLVIYPIEQAVKQAKEGRGEEGEAEEAAEEGILNSGALYFDLRDTMLFGPITQTNTLLMGKSGSAKTILAEMMLAVCYGSNNYGFLPINAGLSEEKLRNFVFNVIREGGELSEAAKETLITSAPGVLLDELNRAPKELLGILQNYLQNGKLVFEGGAQIIPGVRLPSGEVYQFKIGTGNEGRKYAVFQMGKAYRDRFGFEIPITSFPMTEEDRRMLEEKVSTGMYFEECGVNNLENLITIDNAIKQIPTDILARELTRYLGRMSNCVKSFTKSKEDVDEGLYPEMCSGCHAINLHNRVCPEVRAPTERIVIHLQHMAKAFAFMRSYKMVKAVREGKVTSEFMQTYLGSKQKKDLPKRFLESYLGSLAAGTMDVKQAAPFVLMNKIDITPEWIKKNFQGNQGLAINFLMKTVEEKLENYFKANSDILHLYAGAKEGDNPLTEEHIGRLKRYAMKDPWCTDLTQLDKWEKEAGEEGGRKPQKGPEFDLLG